MGSSSQTRSSGRLFDATNLIDTRRAKSSTSVDARNRQLKEFVTQALGGKWPARVSQAENSSPTPSIASSSPSSASGNNSLFGSSSQSTSSYTATSVSSCASESRPSSRTSASSASPSWMDEVLSPQAQYQLTAIASGERYAPEDSSELLDILNCPASPVQITYDTPSWVFDVLSEEARAGLDALEAEGIDDDDFDADKLLMILNGEKIEARCGAAARGIKFEDEVYGAVPFLEQLWCQGFSDECEDSEDDDDAQPWELGVYATQLYETVPPMDSEFVQGNSSGSQFAYQLPRVPRSEV
ncbi:hypothetical protein R3P38DRAFT_93182 [Favolaschia claudopus]|uniref:Uncharacterized protein n=1 Tax=Favolaschia claudopus TaxID=2862362 RepID=A0AAW0D7E0_9AGAR